VSRRGAVLLAAAGWAALAHAAHAQALDPAASGANQAAPAAAAPAPQTAPAEAKAADDFDLLPPEAKPDAATQARDAETQRSLSTRRTMLQLHQLGGFATLAALGTTVVLGQLNYSDKYGGGGDTGRYITPHSIAAYSAAGIFAATGLLALFAPSPFEKQLRLDTATLHKASMAVATAGMVTEVVLGIVTASREGKLSQRDLAMAHQIIGYTTLAATTTGFVVLFF
jgi:hypothetical protein